MEANFRHFVLLHCVADAGHVVRMKPPEIVNATCAQLDELPARSRPMITSERYFLPERVVASFVYEKQLHGL